MKKKHFTDVENGEGDGGGVRAEGEREEEPSVDLRVGVGDETERAERQIRSSEVGVARDEESLCRRENWSVKLSSLTQSHATR